MKIAFNKIILILLLCSSILSAVDTNGAFVDLDEQIYILEDKNSSLNIDMISSQIYADKFYKSSSEGINFGYTDSSYWVRFTLENSSDKGVQRYLEADQVLLSHLELYTPNESGYDKKIMGVMYIPENDSFRNYVYEIYLEANSKKTYYMKVWSSTSEMGFSLLLWSKDALFEKEKKEQIFLAYLFGAFFVMLIYNFFIFISTKDKNYLFYCIYLFTIIIHQMDYFGYGRQYIWGDFAFFSSYGGVFIAGMTIVTVLLFTRAFLQTKKNVPRADKLLQIMIWLGFILGVVLSIPQWHNLELIVHYFFISGLTLIAIGLYLLFKGNRQAKFYIVGWLVLVIGLTIVYLKIIGFLPINNLTTWAGSIGILMEMILLSFGLADKIKQARLEKELMSKKLIQEKQKHHERLEDTVRERTEELNVALKEKDILFQELQHRVKNNMQVILSLLYMQAQRDEDQVVKQKLQEAQSRIKSISLVHDKLFAQDKIRLIDAHDYFFDIASNIIYSYSNEIKNTNLNMDVKGIFLGVDLSIACGLIVNELVTNSMKYAFTSQDENKEIYISLKMINDKYQLIVQDNGKNKKENIDMKNTKGLGLKLVNSLVKSKLKAEISIDQTDGVKYTIDFKGADDA